MSPQRAACTLGDLCARPVPPKPIAPRGTHESTPWKYKKAYEAGYRAGKRLTKNAWREGYNAAVRMLTSKPTSGALLKAWRAGKAEAKRELDLPTLL